MGMYYCRLWNFYTKKCFECLSMAEARVDNTGCDVQKISNDCYECEEGWIVNEKGYCEEIKSNQFSNAIQSWTGCRKYEPVFNLAVLNINRTINFKCLECKEDFYQENPNNTKCKSYIAEESKFGEIYNMNINFYNGAYSLEGSGQLFNGTNYNLEAASIDLPVTLKSISDELDGTIEVKDIYGTYGTGLIEPFRNCKSFDMQSRECLCYPTYHHHMNKNDC